MAKKKQSAGSPLPCAAVCAVCPQKSTNPFSALTQTELVKLAAVKKQKKFKRGEFLFRSGEPVEGIFCLSKGVVKISQEKAHSKEVTLRFAAPGDWVGHRSVFTRDTYRGSAMAREDGFACQVSTSALNDFFASNRSFADLLIRLIAKDLESAEQKLMEHQRLNVPSRMISLFRSLDEKFGVRAQGGRLLDLALTKVEISELIGASPEAVIRQLSQWKKEKLVQEEGGKRLLLTERLLGRVIRRS